MKGTPEEPVITFAYTSSEASAEHLSYRSRDLHLPRLWKQIYFLARYINLTVIEEEKLLLPSHWIRMSFIYFPFQFQRSRRFFHNVAKVRRIFATRRAKGISPLRHSGGDSVVAKPLFIVGQATQVVTGVSSGCSFSRITKSVISRVTSQLFAVSSSVWYFCTFLL